VLVTMLSARSHSTLTIVGFFLCISDHGAVLSEAIFLARHGLHMPSIAARNLDYPRSWASLVGARPFS